MIAENRKVNFSYFIEDTLECGIQLTGNEIKSVRNGHVSIKESYITINNNKLIIKNMNIADFKNRFTFNKQEENRDRLLLAHKSEIRELSVKVQQQGYTIVPTKVYINKDNRCKVVIALCKGKHLHDKREALKNKQIQLDIARGLK